MHTLCTVQYWLDRVLQGPGKLLHLISRGLSNKVYKLNVYTKQILQLTNFIIAKFTQKM
jgi:hypothetical protein